MSSQCGVPPGDPLAHRPLLFALTLPPALEHAVAGAAAALLVACLDDVGTTGMPAVGAEAPARLWDAEGRYNSRAI